MKSITEFQNFTLSPALKVKAALTAEGKTPEEIQAKLAETYKFEGDKLKHFLNSLDVAAQNAENLRRVLVVSLNEGEAAPSKAVKVEETHYIPEFLVQAAAPSAHKADGKGGHKGGGRKGGNSGPKGSPWGLSPEEKAAKNNKGGAAKAPKPS